MALQATREGLQDIYETYYGSKTEHVILLNGSSGLLDTSTVKDFVALEPLAEDGYSRQPIALSGWGWDGVSGAIKSAVSTATFTASASGTIQYDAVGLLIGGAAVPNAEVTAIGGAGGTNNTFSANAHGLLEGDPVIFTDASSFPGGVVAGTIYYVIGTGLTVDDFRISTTPGGTEQSITPSWLGTLIVRNCKGKIICWEQRPDDGSGNRVFTINPSQSKTVSIQIGHKVGV